MIECPRCGKPNPYLVFSNGLFADSRHARTQPAPFEFVCRPCLADQKKLLELIPEAAT